MILHGDSLIKLKELADNSVDSVVCDPPYELGFMGKAWDKSGIANNVELWREVLRVLKPGGHLLSFGGTRTYHRMACAIEDSGFEIRDQLQWIYGSGFPKSLNIGKAVDKLHGTSREVVGNTKTHDIRNNSLIGKVGKIDHQITKGHSQWEGFGTALKPANEPIVLARKPLAEKTVAENVLKYGTGGLNIDASRIEAADQNVLDAAVKRMTGNKTQTPDDRQFLAGTKTIQPNSAQGRWPANLLLDEAAAEMLDEQTGNIKGDSPNRKPRKKFAETQFGFGNGTAEGLETKGFTDSGGASRFFYCAKSSKRERGEGNVHPTVKPIKLMEYLIKLVTPPSGTVLDPFCGSGSTGVAAKRLKFNFIGIELNSEYIEIAERRIGAA